MSELYPKYIVYDGKIIIGKVEFHKDLIPNGGQESLVRGGGWFRHSFDRTCMIFAMSSQDFGKASLESVQACVEAGEIYTRGLVNNISDKYDFAYDMEYELIYFPKAA